MPESLELGILGEILHAGLETSSKPWLTVFSALQLNQGMVVLLTLEYHTILEVNAPGTLL